MMTQHTLSQLHQLRLGGMARALEEQWTLPASHSLSFDERLGLLIQRGSLRTIAGRLSLCDHGGQLVVGRKRQAVAGTCVPPSSASRESIDGAALKTEPRNGGKTAARCMAAEAQRIEAACPRGARRVVLDEHGTRLTTAQLAARLHAWRGEGRDVALLVGGPDGLDPVLKATADETLRLSDLTLPHAFVRVLLAEALYRAWSLTEGHPYHRE